MNPTLKQAKTSKLPPLDFIEKVVNGPYNAIQTYFKLWRQKDEKNNVLIFRMAIQDKFYITSERFLRDVVSLASENILSWHKDKVDMRVFYKITLKA